MILIEKLHTIKNKKGHPIMLAKFLCPILECNTEVIRQLGNGLRAKSCGCITSKLKSESKKGKIVTEETRQKISIGNKGKKRTEEQKNKYSKAKKGENHPMYGKNHTKEAKQRIREARTGIYIREFAPNWQGGISDNPYPQEFSKELKQQILVRDNYICQCPDCEGKSSKLDIHHIDYDKENNTLENLITLCSSCHGKTKGKNNRQYWIEYYKSLIFYHK